MTGRLAMLTARWKICRCRLSATECRNGAGGTACQRAGGQENAIRDGIASAILPGRFQIVASRHALFLMSRIIHMRRNIYRAYESATEKRVRAGGYRYAHDKDIAGTLAWLKSVVDDWYVRHWKGRAVPRQNNCLSIWERQII